MSALLALTLGGEVEARLILVGGGAAALLGVCTQIVIAARRFRRVWLLH